MSIHWTDKEQDRLVATLGILCTLLGAAYFGLPANSTYPLLKFQLPLHPFLTLILLFWGAALFFMMLSYLPIGKKHQIGYRAVALLWLIVQPAVFGWLFWLIAMDVSYPLVDPLIIPAFVLGAFGIVVAYLKLVEIDLFHGLRRILVWTRSRL